MTAFVFGFTPPAPTSTPVLSTYVARDTAIDNTDYGSDFAGALDIDPLMRERAPSDALLVAESLLARLDTPRGGLIAAPGYGYDIGAELRRPMTQREVDAIPARVRAELMQDDRVEQLSVRATRDGDALAITIECATVHGESFALTGLVSSDDIAMELRS
jgi:hypothetical protein